MVVATEHLLVRAEVEAGEIEVGKGVAMADVEEEVRRALVIAVLEHLDQRKAEHALEELHRALDVAADESDVVYTAGGGGGPFGSRCEVLRCQFFAACGEPGALVGIDSHSGNSTGSVGNGQKTTAAAPASIHF